MVLLKFLHNKVVLHKVEVTVDEMNKLIGILHYGGWKKDDVKYVVDDYYLVEFSPLEVHVNLQTDIVASQKVLEQLSNNLSDEFKNRLVPAFQRRNKDELN